MPQTDTVKSGGVLSPRLFIFLFSFSLLTVYSLSPTVYAGDSSLFSAASFHLGTAHPPAYPLLMLLGKLFTLLPLGNIAFKVNLLSTVSGALAATIAYDAALYMTGNRLSSLLAPLVTLSSSMFILEASKAEAYVLNAFLVTLVFYLCLKAAKDDHPFRFLIIASFLIGIGMGNHHTIGFIGLLLALVYVLRFKEFPVHTVPLMTVFLLAGFIVNSYTILRSVAGGFLTYSQAGSLKEFLEVFFRTAYQGNTVTAVESVAAHGMGWAYAARNLVSIMNGEIYFVALALLIPAFIGRTREKKILLTMLGALLVWVPLAKMTMADPSLSPNQRSITGPYFLQLVPIIAVFSAMGLSSLGGFLKRYSRLVSYTLIAGVLIVQSVMISISVQRSSLSDYSIAYNWMRDISKVVPTGSLFLASGDNPSFMSFYLFGTERLRDDLVVLDSVPGSIHYRTTLATNEKFSQIFPQLDSEVIATSFLNRFAKERRLYTSSFSDLPPVLTDNFDIKGYPLTFVLLPKGTPYPVQQQFMSAFEKIDYLPIVLGHRKDMMTSEINNHYARTIMEYAKMLAEARSGEAEHFFKLSYLLSDENLATMVLQNYVIYIAVEQGPDAARLYLEQLESESQGRKGNMLQTVMKWYKDLDKSELQRAYENKTFTTQEEESKRTE